MMALRRRALRGPRARLARRVLGGALVLVGATLWVVAARSFGLGHASVAVALAGALVAAGLVLIVTSF